MINEKELRPGNLYCTMRNLEIVVKAIDTVNKFVVVDPISVNLEITSKNENSIIFEDLNDIDLTEERAMQLGLLGKGSESPESMSDNGAKFSWDEKKNYLVLNDGNNGTIGISIKYLHQLQNIYFYLTGKELPLV